MEKSIIQYAAIDDTSYTDKMDVETQHQAHHKLSHSNKFQRTASAFSTNLSVLVIYLELALAGNIWVKLSLPFKLAIIAD